LYGRLKTFNVHLGGVEDKKPYQREKGKENNGENWLKELQGYQFL
jgi:hypothetical protein